MPLTLFFNNEEVKIKKAKLRGIESCGMICAEDEFGISSLPSGIYVVKAGGRAAKVVKQKN